MLDVVVLNVLFILSPIACYLIYIVYENSFGEKANDLFFTFSIITSAFLIIKYSTYFNYSTDILKVLLIICMIKEKKCLSILISTLIIIFFNMTYDINIYMLIIQYFIQLTTFFILFKTCKLNYKLVIFIIIEIICNVSFYDYLYIYILISNICYILLGYIITKLINKIIGVISIYGTVMKIEEDKKFRDTLFKITHEIKNPIAVCKGYLDMLDINNSKQISKYIPIIKQEIERTLTLMNDFLSLNKLKIEKKDMDMTLLLDDICNSVEELLMEKNIHFIFDITDDSVYINGDYDRLKQVMINIIKNSMESIEKKVGVINLRMIVKKNRIFIFIADNGKGMDKDTLKRIGEPFFTTKKFGTGLGIKLSKEIIDMHKGKIKYSSKLDVGTKVTIELPISK